MSAALSTRLRIMRNWFLRLFIFLIWSWAKSVAKREKPVKNSISDCASSVRRAGGRMNGSTEKVPSW